MERHRGAKGWMGEASSGGRAFPRRLGQTYTQTSWGNRVQDKGIVVSLLVGA